jgi:hypothetical protein
MSAGVNIEFTGDASGVQAAADQASEAVDSVGSTTTATTMAGTNSLMGLTGSFTMMGITGVMAYDMVSSYGARYAMMQSRVQIAQENVTKALMEYGAGSIQVIQAQQQLSAVTDEAKYAQGEYNREMLMMGAMFVPQLMMAMPKLVTAIQMYTGVAREATVASNLLGASMLGLVGAGIGIVAMVALMSFAGSTTGPSSSSVNVYGDVNMGGYANPYQFGTSVQSWTSSMRG